MKKSNMKKLQLTLKGLLKEFNKLIIKYETLISESIKSKQKLHIFINNEEDILVPKFITEEGVIGFSFIDNSEKFYKFKDISKINYCNQYFIEREESNDVNMIFKFINERISKNCILRIGYVSNPKINTVKLSVLRREGFTPYIKEGEIDITTIRDFHVKYLNKINFENKGENFIDAYCYSRIRRRPFKISRIFWVEELIIIDPNHYDSLTNNIKINDDDDLPF
jgi:hypothetical protein